MNIGFFYPISERWIKPRPEKERDPVPTVSMGEALLAAVEEKGSCHMCGGHLEVWQLMIDAALKD